MCVCVVCVKRSLMSLHPISAFAWYGTLHYAFRSVVHKVGKECVLIWRMFALGTAWNQILSICSLVFILSIVNSIKAFLFHTSWLYCIKLFSKKKKTAVNPELFKLGLSYVQHRRFHILFSVFSLTCRSERSRDQFHSALTCDLALAQKNIVAGLVYLISMQYICTSTE